MEFSEVIEVLDRGSSIDVQSNCTFESLMIGQKTLERLKNSQFDRPSPVQARAIPVGLLGRDMLVQAKSGTGKTLVFSVLAVENLDSRSSHIQKVIVTPTREISVQIKETVRKVAPTGARTSVYVGGSAHKLNLIDLKQTRPQIVIGTPGRIAQLVKLGAMNMSHVDFFVLDEADKLMDEVFRDDINIIINSLPQIRQVAVFSATYPRNLDNLLSTFLRDAALVRFNADDVQLFGIKQYVVAKCSPMLEKLTHVLKSIRYVQALVFCDQISKCEPIATHLKSSGLDVTFVSSAMSQKDRQLAVDQLRAKRVKILVSSDLTARGIDADNVNLVVNIDAAANEETYFHRIGRAARFGAHGAAVTLLEDERALKGFTALAYRGKVTVKRVVEGVHELPGDLVKNQEFWKDLPYFIDFETPPTGPNDLNKVPDRQSAVESLKSEREASGIVTSSSKKYTRDEMMAMRSDTKNEQSVEEISAKIENLSVETETDEKENVVEVKKTFKERLAELKAAKAAAKSQTEPEAPKSEPKSKFKFVPTREKAKKKYYMRGELQHIREAFTSEQWRAYAETKFDFTEEPFLGGPVESKSAENSQISSSGDVGKAEILENVEKTEQNPPKIIKSRNVQIGSQEDVGNSKNAEKTPLRGSEASKNAENSQISSSGDIGKAEILENGENPVKNPPKTIKYNRFEMKKIQKEVPKDSWIPYVKSKWNTTEEPWELDQWLRCPFEERLRRQRKREKDERRKVIEDRKKRRDEDRQELVSSGRITKVVEIRETSWQDYQARVRREFEEATEKRRKMMTEGAAEVLRRIGPVVPQRTPPLIYRYRVDMYKRRLDEQDAYLQHQNKLDDGILKETEAQTTAENPEKSMEMVEIECQTDEIQEELAEDEEYWDEEYWDEEELEGSEGSQEIFDDFPDVVEELEGSEGSEEASEAAPRAPQLEHLAAGYLRNMNFQAATQSYIDLMNSFARNFGGN